MRMSPASEMSIPLGKLVMLSHLRTGFTQQVIKRENSSPGLPIYDELKVLHPENKFPLLPNPPHKDPFLSEDDHIVTLEWQKIQCETEFKAKATLKSQT